MNSKQVSIVTLAVCGLVVLVAGCRCSPPPQSASGIPQVTIQPEESEVFTNQDAKLSVEVLPIGKDSYSYLWYKEVQSPFCEQADSVAFTYQLQTNFPGWNTTTLLVTNATPADQANYFCVVSHELKSEPLTIIQTRTRPAFLQVYQATGPHITSTNMAIGIPQIISSPIANSGQQNVKTCNLASYNGTKSFNVDDHNAPFKATSPSGTLRVSRLSNNIYTALDASKFTVRVYPTAPVGAPFCPSINSADTTALQFTATLNTTYKFVVYLLNADGATYQFSVQFN